MNDSEFNTIQAVENLQNVAGLTPMGQRQERKRRQNPPRQDQGPAEAPADKAATERENDSQRIDYCA
ncbi:MAG: hypothetical protein M1376_20790 [Planctomycetes bacterium]|nr:hypothetical protein [Planctomycetota bacterium]